MHLGAAAERGEGEGEGVGQKDGDEDDGKGQPRGVVHFEIISNIRAVLGSSNMNE